MVKPNSIDDITEVDIKSRLVTHTPSGLQIGWPETPSGKFSTVFRIVFRGKGVQFQLKWQIKKGKEGETLICQPEIKDGMVRKPEEDPINMFVEEVYACLWAYSKHVDPNTARLFAMVYGDNIYTGNVRIPMKEN